METIRINFCGFWSSFNKENNLFTRILGKNFKIEISENPDFVICSNRGKPFEYMKYDCVRIMFMGENMSPDWTAFDYCIGFDHMQFGDRYFRLPFAFYFDDGVPWRPEKLSKETAKELLEKKKYFCNFIYRHPSSHGMREQLFRRLEQYKPVYSPGNYLNNAGYPGGVSWKEKRNVLELSKFTIAGDSIHYPGFVTEKIVQPFEHHSIPIYFGSTTIMEDFNTDAFIWCKEEQDLEKTVEQVIALDQNDEAYIKMLTACPLPQEDALVKKYQQLEEFLLHIFEQSPERARRRIRYFCAAGHEKFLKDCMEKADRISFRDQLNAYKKAAVKLFSGKR